MDKSYAKKNTHKRIIRHIVCILLALISIFPFYVLIINATRDSAAIQRGISLVPGSNLAANYKHLINDTSKTAGVTLWKALFNSLIVTVPATVLQIYFGTLTAYAVTVYEFKLKKFAWGFIYGIMMIPTQISIVGLIKVCNLTHLYGTFWPLILPAAAAPTTVYFMKQYMETGFSIEIVEAARIDGSSEIRTFNQICLPLVKPAMATQAIFGFVASWNNLYTPSIILATERQKMTMPMYVSSLKANDKSRDFGVIYIGLFITVIPILVAYFFLSKYIIAGVALGGVKE